MLNRAEIIGRLGADPEMRKLPSGMAACNIRLATDESYKDKEDKKVERTEWHRITSFGKLAEVMGEHLTKGRLVFVSGTLRTRKWTDEKGVDRYTTEIVANQMRFLDSPKKSEPAPDSGAGVNEEVPY